MLTAIMSDIHANKEALVACMAHARRAGALRTIYLGDYVGYGADPVWVLETVRGEVEAGAVALLSNHDEAVMVRDDQLNKDARAAIEWTRTQIGDSMRAFLAERPLSHREGHRLYVHANAWAPAGWAYITNAVEAERSLRRTDARITICGHVHKPALYVMSADKPAQPFIPIAGSSVPLIQRRHWLCVVGSVGQPRDGNPAAAYSLLDDATDTIVSVRVPYDVETAAAKILAAGLPARLAERLHVGR